MRKEEKHPISQWPPRLSSCSCCFSLQGRGPATGLSEIRLSPLPLCSLVTIGYRCRQRQKAYRCGGWGRMLIRIQIKSSEQRAYRCTRKGLSWKHLTPQPSDLASLGLIVPHNAQRKYAPYVHFHQLAEESLHKQNKNNILKRTFTDSPGVLLCVTSTGELC